MSHRPSAAAGARLLRWFDRARRDLPWRHTTDPWAIWVSEVMLQQTRVEAVREPYRRFLAAFPDPGAFAAADDDALLVAWRGLGYYRRARLLREGARRVAAEHGGAVPRDAEALRGLPGIGDYTFGAVASIAFGQPEVAIDGNVLRVIARHRGVGAAIETAAARKAIRAVSSEWLDVARPGDFNQALMELGAVVCTPTSPRCAECPLAADCVARATGRTGELPVQRRARANVEVAARVVLVSGRGGVLGHRVPAGEPNAGQVDLPGGGVLVSVDAADLPARLRQRFGARVDVGAELASVRHAITNHRITVHAHAGVLRSRGALGWFPLHAATPWTTPARKVFRRTFGADGTMLA